MPIGIPAGNMLIDLLVWLLGISIPNGWGVFGGKQGTQPECLSVSFSEVQGPHNPESQWKRDPSIDETLARCSIP